MKRPTQAQFDKAAADVAFSYAPQILECQKCGWPHATGYVCGYCGDESPTSPPEKAPTEAKTYRDVGKCPAKHRIVTIRRVGTAGRVVRTYCTFCRRAYQIKAGPLPTEKGQNNG